MSLLAERRIPKVNYDENTKKYLDNHIGQQTTVCMCNKCGLFYKPSLGHKCNDAGE